MTIAILVVIVFLILAAALAVYLVRRPGEAPPPKQLTDAVDEDAGRAERQAVLEQRGSELLERRVELDARRGALGGQQEIFEAFEQLENRLRSGEITEEEFEREKVRLLGG